MSNPTTPFSWQMPTATDLVTDLPADFEVFGQAVATSMADLLGGTSGQILAKNSNTDMDFTWVTTDDANAIQNSIVDAKGDLVAASANDTPARLAVGNNGETLVADSAAATGLRYSATPSASNPVLNSTFQVAQRGTSFTGVTSNQYTLDRWILWATAGSMSIYNSQQTTSDTTNLPNIQFCSRVGRTAANTATGTVAFLQSFETINSRPFSGKTVTMSFYARKGANFSATSNVLTSSLSTGTGTDQNYSSGYTGQVDNAQSNTLTATWQRFTQTVSVGATATELTTLFYFAPTGTAGAADYFEITGVQIDIGNVALPYRTNQPTYQAELAACQRYYQRFVAGASNGNFGQGWSTSATTPLLFIDSKVTLRVIPTAIDVGGGIQIQSTSNAQYSVTSIALDTSRSNQNRFAFSGTTVAAVGGLGCQVQGSSDANAFIGFTGEL
jgi:hypothetical protein